MSATTMHIDDRIADLLLGDVCDREREALEAHVAGCARCARELMQAADAFAAMALALPAEPPSPSLRARVLADAKPPRLAPMIDKVAALFDVSRGRARSLLERIDDPAAWLPGPIPDSWVLPAENLGPKVADAALVGFVKMGAGVAWPTHKHHGLEHMLVVEGGFRQHDGVEVHPGDLHVMVEGSVHGFTIFSDEPCVAAAVVWGGISFDDPALKLGDPSK